MTVILRGCNDGFVYRYTDVTAGRKDNKTVMSEVLQIVLPKGTVTFAGGYGGLYRAQIFRAFNSGRHFFCLPLIIFMLIL